MPGIAGTNVDFGGYVMDPTQPYFIQDNKQMGAHPQLTIGRLHMTGGFRTVQITTAQVLALNTTPIQLVPAPGAGLVVVPYLMVASMVYNSTTYSTNAAGASLAFGANGAGTAVGLTLTQTFLQSASTSFSVVSASTTAYSPLATDVNQPLTLIAASSNPTTGNSDLYVRVYFRVIGLPLFPSTTTAVFP